MRSWAEAEAGDGETDTYYLTVPAGTTSVKVTLVWDDYPGSMGADPALVNDLDLRVYDANSVRKYPWTLDKDNPSNAAVRTAEDHLNNVEQVYVDSGIASGSWRVEVHGTSIPQGPQRYTVLFTPQYTTSGPTPTPGPTSTPTRTPTRTPTPTATSAPQAPTPPSNMRSGGVTASSITWQWNDNSGNETGFHFHSDLGNHDFGAGTTSHQDTGLSANPRHWAYATA